jgi:antitoxin (DNA-binding transcriptional repressor) of toxin-antitoxin stability system
LVRKEVDMGDRVMAVGELKPQFSEVLKEVRAGREIVVSYGRRRDKVAILVPYGRRRRAGGSVADSGRGAPGAAKIGHGLDGFIGSWVDDPGVDQALAELRTVDPEMWR